MGRRCPVCAQLRGVAVSSLHDAPRQPFAADIFEPSSTSWSLFVPPAHVASSRPRRQYFFPAQHILSWPSFKEPGAWLLYARRNFARTALLKAFKSRIIDPPKTAAVLSSCSSTYILIPKQRAPRSQKRAGVETTLRTAWIERPIFSWFCLDDSSAGRRSKQVPDAAVVRDVLSWSLLTIFDIYLVSFSSCLHRERSALESTIPNKSRRRRLHTTHSVRKDAGSSAKPCLSKGDTLLIPGGSTISSRGQTSFWAIAIKGCFVLDNSCKQPKWRHFVDADIHNHILFYVCNGRYFGVQKEKTGIGEQSCLLQP